MNLQNAIKASKEGVAYSRGWDLVGLIHAPYGHEEICVINGISYWKVDILCGYFRPSPIPYDYRLTNRLPLKMLPADLRTRIESEEGNWQPLTAGMTYDEARAA